MSGPILDRATQCRLCRNLNFRHCPHPTFSFPRNCSSATGRRLAKAASTLPTLSFLHTAISDADDVTARLLTKVSSGTDTVRWMREDGAPRFTIAEHPAGLVLGAARRGDPGETYWRISQFLMPNHGLAPNAFAGENYHGQCWVPIDDTSCWIHNYTWNPERPLTDAERARYRAGSGIHAEVDANYVLIRRRENDYLIDRVKQKTESYTGIDGVSEQDACIQDSQGLIADRTTEHLGPTDMGVIRFRRLMLEAVRALASNEPPSAPRCPKAFRVQGGGAVAPSDMTLADVMCARFGHEHGLSLDVVPNLASV